MMGPIISVWQIPPGKWVNKGYVFLADQLERVFLRLGHAETDEQLQDIISKFLPPVLLKLSSVQEGVRKKVRRV